MRNLAEGTWKCLKMTKYSNTSIRTAVLEWTLCLSYLFQLSFRASRVQVQLQEEVPTTPSSSATPVGVFFMAPVFLLLNQTPEEEAKLLARDGRAGNGGI